MKIIDNDPIDKPCIGELIEEQCAVGQFADNCLYLIADPEADIAKRAVDIMEQFKQIADCDDYYNTYELEVVQNVELKNHPKIKEYIEQHGDNFLIQLASHGFNEKKRFIVAKTDNDKLFENINLMIYAAPILLCPECTPRMSGCYGCVHGNECAFETDPSPIPKLVQKQIQQGPMIQIIQVRNPDRIAQTCAINCKCWDGKNNKCNKENDHCDYYLCSEI